MSFKPIWISTTMENNNPPLKERIKYKDIGDLLTFASHTEEPNFKPVCTQHTLRHEPRDRVALQGPLLLFGFTQRFPLALATGQQMPPPSAPLRAQSSPSSHQPLPRSSEDRLSGESRAPGCALPPAQSSRSLQQQPQRCQLESKRLSQDVFPILFLVTSAFTLHVPPGCPSSTGLSRAREAQGWPRPELSLSPTFWGTQQLLHPNISPRALSGPRPHLGSAKEGTQGVKCITWGRTPLLQAQQLWLLKELNHQPSQTPKTG